MQKAQNKKKKLFCWNLLSMLKRRKFRDFSTSFCSKVIPTSARNALSFIAFLMTSHNRLYLTDSSIGSSLLARDNIDISFSEVRLLEYPRGTRQIGHLFNFTRHLQQIVCPLLHWKTGLVSGICKQTGHSRCPAILDFRVSSFQSSSLKSIF